MSFVLTFVASRADHPVTPHILDEVERIFKPADIHRTCEPVWLAPNKAIDVGIDRAPSRAVMDDIRAALVQDKIDVFINEIEGRRKKLLIADMDSTIVQGETLDDLAAHAGIKDRIAEITARAMDGQLDFHSAIRERVGLLKGLSEDALHKTLEQTPLNVGAEKLVRVMKNNGALCVLVSGGFTFFTRTIAAQVGFMMNHGNELIIEDGVLTGGVGEPIQDKFSKVAFMRHYMEELEIKERAVMAIGDGANDVPMLELAGLGIGYHPKPSVVVEIDNIIHYGDLTAALYAQGYTAGDVEG